MIGLKTLRNALACLFLLTLSFEASAKVQLPHGEFFKNIEDLRVKVMGGQINVGRTYYKGEWFFNRDWAPLVLEVPSSGTSAESIHLSSTGYSSPSSSRRAVTLSDGSIGYRLEVTYSNADRRTEWLTRSGEIAGSADAPDTVAENLVPDMRWENTNGDWKEYQLTASGTSARIIAYGNRTGAVARFTYDAEDRLSGIRDRNDTQVVWYDYYADGKLQYVRDVENHRVEYRYTGDLLTEVIDTRGHSWQYGYTRGLLTSIIDPETRTTAIVYGNSKRVDKVVRKDNAGNRIETGYRFDYDKTKKEYYVQVKDPLGSVTESWYNTSSQLIRKTINGVQTYAMSKDTNGSREIRTILDRRGLKTVKEYDEWENLVKTTYPDGSFTTTEYKPGTNLVTEHTDELGRVTKYDYYPEGLLERLTEAVGTPVQRITEYRYNADGLRIEKKILADADSVETITGYGYDAQGNLDTLTDPEEGITRFTHNIRGDVLIRTDPNEKPWENTYDPAGNLLTQADPLGHTVILTYDKVGNLKTRENALHDVTSYTYNLLDKRITQTDPYIKTTKMGYDDTGRLSSIEDPLRNEQKIHYDLEGRMISQEDAAGNLTTLGYGEGTGQGGGVDGTTNYPGLLNRIQYPTYLQTYDYDKRGRKTQTIDHLDDGPAVTVTKYDLVGNKIETLDAELRKTEYRYDALNRLREIIDPALQSTFFKYDNRDNLIEVTDPNVHTTKFTYDKADRKKSEIRHRGQTITYGYDPAGNLTSVTDPDGRKTVNHYDDAGRLDQQEHFAIGASVPERTVDYGYDDNNNLTSWGDGTISSIIQFDKNDRKLSEAVDYGAFSLGHSYTYDEAGNKKTYTGPDGVTITYHWDKSLLRRIEIPTEGSVYYNSYKWTRPDKITWPGGSTRTVTYDGDLKPKHIVDLDPGENPLLDYEYIYDKTGNIDQKITQDSSYDYDYDLLQRLTEAKSEDETEGWSYDPNGNRKSDNLNPGTWDYDENDRLLESPGVTYGYDAAGNTTSKTEGGVTTTYIYNAEGRLSRVEDASGTMIAEYAYDPLGRRYKKTTQSETLYFHYADEGLVGEFDSAGASVRHYGYVPDSTWTTDPLYVKSAAGYGYYRNDHLGVPQQVISKNGFKEWEGVYRAFGEVKAETGSLNQRLRFPGQYEDNESNWYYNYHRYYISDIGRYHRRDPIGIKGGLNVYGYGNNNPNTNIDQYGLALVKRLSYELRQIEQVLLPEVKVGKRGFRLRWYVFVDSCCKQKVTSNEYIWQMYPIQASGEAILDVVVGYVSVDEKIYTFYPPSDNPCCTCETTLAGYEYDNGLNPIEDFWDNVLWDDAMDDHEFSYYD